MNSDVHHASRVQRLQAKLESQDIKGCLLIPGPNMHYFLGFRTRSWERLTLALLPSGILVVPALDLEKARRFSAAEEILHYSDEEGPKSTVDEAIKKAGITDSLVGVEGVFPFWIHEMLRSIAPSLSLVDISDIIARMRVVKDEEELDLIRRASNAVEKGIMAARDMLRPDLTEAEVKFELEKEIIQEGAEEVPFCVVQSGENSALPHGEASSKKIRTGETVVIDAGATVGGYHADITRTFFLGDPDEKQNKLFELVQSAHTNAIEVVRAGVSAEKVDQTARTIIAGGGLGEHFIHRTGHGLGLEVHEPPYIKQGNSEPLVAGMVFTVEPGIYLTEEFGVRIEDDILVKEDGYENLTRLPKDLEWCTLES